MDTQTLTPRRTRIVLDPLPPRPEGRETALDAALERLGRGAGEPCALHCDCRIGLACREGLCTDTW